MVGWYADRRSEGENHQELSRIETEIDGRQDVQVEYEACGQEGRVSREMTWFIEAYGIVWQVTCTSVDGDRYGEYLSTLMEAASALVALGLPLDRRGRMAMARRLRQLPERTLVARKLRRASLISPGRAKPRWLP